MEARRVESAQGWQWLVGGWSLFTRNPGIMVLYVVIWFGIAIIAGMIPFIGGLAMALVTPALLAGWYEAADLSSREEAISANTLFEGFRRREKTGPLITLGAILLGGQLALMVVVMIFIGGGALGMMGAAGHSGGMMTGGQIAFSAGVVFGLLMALIGATILLMAYLYAVPLIWFGGLAPMDALKSSFSACLRNVMPLLVFSLIYLILIPLAILPFGLGMLVLIPVSLSAIYASYRDLYPPDSPEGMSAPPRGGA